MHPDAIPYFFLHIGGICSSALAMVSSFFVLLCGSGEVSRKVKLSLGKQRSAAFNELRQVSSSAPSSTHGSTRYLVSGV